MRNGAPDDFIYPVRLYASSYMDITDYIVQGKTNMKQPLAPRGNPSGTGEPPTQVRVTYRDPEEHRYVLRNLRRRLPDPPEGLVWLLAPKDEFFFFTQDMPRVVVPDPTGDGVREGSDNDIYIAVWPWREGFAAP